MRCKHWFLCAFAAVALSGLPADATLADELQTPPAPESADNRPTRGMSMERVEAAYGSPSNRIPAVGEPPITRWEYPGFVVYFEHNLVIHSVARS